MVRGRRDGVVWWLEFKFQWYLDVLLKKRVSRNIQIPGGVYNNNKKKKKKKKNVYLSGAHQRQERSHDTY